MNKKTITLIALALIIAATAYVGYNSLNQLEEFDFEDPFDTELDSDF
ncbi:MAG UNVERIFIED_CONTAM: hypothetical protein LVQ98_07820 [Rickettsiaceae bacterium]|jgi:hypothetical protein